MNLFEAQPQAIELRYQLAARVNKAGVALGERLGMALLHRVDLGLSTTLFSHDTGPIGS